MQLNNALWVLVSGMMLEIAILIFLIIIVINFKVWATKRDKFYSKKIDEFEDRIRIVEKHYLEEVSKTVKETKELVEKINFKFKF